MSFGYSPGWMDGYNNKINDAIKNNNQTDTDQSTSSEPVQKQNEPVNKKKTSKINNQSTTTAKKVS